MGHKGNEEHPDKNTPYNRYRLLQTNETRDLQVPTLCKLSD